MSTLRTITFRHDGDLYRFVLDAQGTIVAIYYHDGTRCAPDYPIEWTNVPDKLKTEVESYLISL